MSLRRLQQLVVLLHHDPERAARLSEAELVGDDLTAAEIQWLLAVDPRAWSTDRYRADRVLTGVIEELPVTSGLVVGAGQLSVLRSFARGPEFAALVEHRGTLVEAYADFLARLIGGLPASAGALAGRSLSLERAIARARRREVVAVKPGMLEPGPGVMVAEVGEGTLGTWSALRERLKPGHEVAGVMAGLTATGEQEVAPGWVLIQAGAASEIGEAIGELIAGLPCTQKDFLARSEALGATTEEAAELLAGLLADGVLVEGVACADHA